MRKKRIILKYFIVCEFFLELQCLVDDLVDVLELSMFIKAYIQWKWLTFDEVERGPGHEKKNFFSYIPLKWYKYISFFSWICYWCYKLITCSCTCREYNVEKKVYNYV